MEPQKQQSYIKIKKSGILKHPNIDIMTDDSWELLFFEQSYV